MSKITFRADDALVEDLEALELSKSEAMREALRAYLDGPRGTHSGEASRSSAAQSDVNGAEGEHARNRDHGAVTEDTAIDDIVRERVDELVSERLTALGLDPTDPMNMGSRAHPHANESQDINVTISLADRELDTHQQHDSHAQTRGHVSDTRHASDAHPAVGHDVAGRHHDGPSDTDHTHDQTAGPAHSTSCAQCGESVDEDHVYCPNCGEKASHRLFCECGDEFRSDWAFCPGCGRRTPSADVLESNSRQS
ncbi:CopG family transcriptional regulator [Natronolimnobius sp. AArcel1]|uniref:double zinc ribbon domain-containing protein n=1 Tax=Natronolimnobius sp. AArcel1 TaxID=1679093 RepID=UPI0013EA804B|nr:zinc ribbon domain-containing protein [Natronolimnobius sp. AArcel1]NGM67869.1 CopG family transcriptional regulator [Natronolimnobius sp. AArcel1]